MRSDIQEIKTIMGELSEIRPAQHADLLLAAIQVQRSRILKKALVLSDADTYPGALEKTAMELEGLKSLLADTRDAVLNISTSIEEINQNRQ